MGVGQYAAGKDVGGLVHEMAKTAEATEPDLTCGAIVQRMDRGVGTSEHHDGLGVPGKVMFGAGRVKADW